MVSRKYLNAAPRPGSWEEKYEKLLQSFGGDEGRRQASLQQTLDNLRKFHEEKKRTGPGRRSHSEHAIAFYEYALARSKKEVETPKKHSTAHDSENDDDDDDDDDASMDTQEFLDQHNDHCDVCSKGGELLCCSTCNLVFHLSCLRPALSELPDGDWSCAHCIVQGVRATKRTSKAYKTAVSGLRRMERLKEDKERGAAQPTKDDKVEDSSDSDDSSDASEMKDIEETPRKRSPSKQPTTPNSEGSIASRSKRERKQPKLYKPSEEEHDKVERDQSKAQSSTKTPTGIDDNEEDSGGEKHDTFHENTVDGKDVVCTFCRDDPSIPICCFCACRSCFGKHDKDKLLICDDCENEYHTFCLKPPLKAVPSKKWSCPSCVAEKSATTPKKSLRRLVKASRKVTDASETIVKRGPGRPPKKSPGRPTKISTTHTPTKRSPGRPPKSPGSSKTPTGRPRGRPPKNSPASGTKTPTGRPRGRPPKNKPTPDSTSASPAVPRKRGRPPKNVSPSVDSAASSPRKRGRPPKSSYANAEPSTKKSRKSPGPDEESTQSKRRARESAGTPGRTKASIAASDESLGTESKPIIQSRSGRVVKRSSFHDEIEEGEQHLRADRGRKDSFRSKSPKEDSGPDGQKSIMTSTHPDDAAADGAKQVLSPGSASGISDDIDMGDANAFKVVEEEPIAGGSTPIAAVVRNAGPLTAEGVSPEGRKESADESSLGNSTNGGDSKNVARAPRRKPGARECMQISRKFGNNVIPARHMDTLLDYCKRGKVEHLIRMRERLDEHSRFLEAQLAGLEGLVKEKGELDIVVPPMMKRPEIVQLKPPPSEPKRPDPLSSVSASRKEDEASVPK